MHRNFEYLYCKTYLHFLFKELGALGCGIVRVNLECLSLDYFALHLKQGSLDTEKNISYLLRCWVMPQHKMRV